MASVVRQTKLDFCQYSHKHCLKCVPSMCKRGFIFKKGIRFSFGAVEDIVLSTTFLLARDNTHTIYKNYIQENKKNN